MHIVYYLRERASVRRCGQVIGSFITLRRVWYVPRNRKLDAIVERLTSEISAAED